ncbi:hypothetical protein QFC24_000733 [Naganishia onofrii]|uniref:Uncharacterized protein n=1 Tax=Naganishia onofrii TaxID=1851511 RepID=A0ACC2XUK9_9TREE|nr:hypothetical protein QFC24_000733 [Naganishia onofrii]
MPVLFLQGIKFISSMLVYEASKQLSTEQVPGLQSPIAEFSGTIISQKIGLVPILRAGIGMTDAALEHFPDARVLHLGLFREKTTLQVIEYYSKLPASPNVDMLYVLDRKRHQLL